MDTSEEIGHLVHIGYAYDIIVGYFRNTCLILMLSVIFFKIKKELNQGLWYWPILIKKHAPKQVQDTCPFMGLDAPPIPTDCLGPASTKAHLAFSNVLPNQAQPDQVTCFLKKRERVVEVGTMLFSHSLNHGMGVQNVMEGEADLTYHPASLMLETLHI